jgi:N-acetylmuramoyl-L-alanine amidase
MPNRRNYSFFIATLLLFQASLSFSTKTVSTIKDRRVGWLRDGQKIRAHVTEVDGRDYISVSQLASISSAGLDWQSVSSQVCLSRNTKNLCFDWGNSKVFENGKPVKNGADVYHAADEVYVPVHFILSEEFERFTGTKIQWDENAGQFIQNSPVTIVLPPVENMGEHYRLRLDVADGVRYELLQKDDRKILLRFIGGRSAGSAILEGDNVIHRVRLVQRAHSTDVVVELGGAAISNDVYYDEADRKLVVEVERSIPQIVVAPKRDVKPISAPIPVAASAEATEAVAAPVSRVNLAVKRDSPKPVSDTRIRTIVIDAGHGGHDAGAIGVRGTYEKDINLKVAKMLADRLSKERNVRVILTRSTDEFIPLAERTQIANDARADLFVSIHCNSSLSSKHTGLELYVLSPSATDEASEAVARLENSVIALESKKSVKVEKVSELLASMAVNNYINESLECATLLGRAIKAQVSVNSSAVKEANFFVLRGAQMPSVLVELEYVSNPISELKLRSSRYQSQFAKALASGLMDVDKRFRKKQESMAARTKAFDTQQ